jgi:peptide deformylase
MARLEIITVPHPTLKTTAYPVENIDETVITQARDMKETMYASNGIGLAANQVNMLNRLIIMDISEKEGQQNSLCLINPEVVWSSENFTAMDEGCLSIPEQQALVERPASVKVKYIDLGGIEQVFEAHGLHSHCVQHEIDHLNGILCIDYLSKLKRSMVVRKIEKMKRSGVL